MHKTISVTWPWTRYKDPEAIVADALALGADDLCIRATDGNALYGIGLKTKAQWRGKCYLDLEKAAKLANLTTSIWCALRLVDWAGDADAIHKAADYYNPPVIWIDAEALAKKNIANLGPFLRRLGRMGTRVVAVQSYRRADLHREMAWRKWYGYKDEASGRYVIDGLGHQLYPIGTHGLAAWVEDWKRAIAAHEAEAAAVGRPGMDWYPTVPAFIGGAYEGQKTPWEPTGDEVVGAVQWMIGELGDRVKRINFWALDTDLVHMPKLFAAIAALELPVSTETPAPLAFPQLAESKRWELVERGLKLQGVLDSNGVPRA